MTEFDLQAQAFMEKHNVVIGKEFLGYKPYFSDDDKPRNVWKITIARGTRSFSFTFGDSLANSEVPMTFMNGSHGIIVSSPIGDFPSRTWKKGEAKAAYMRWYYSVKRGKPSVPSDYAILACLSTDSYCDCADEFEFGEEFCYDPPKSWADYRKLRDTYEACKKQAAEIQRVFYDCLDELREIQ